MDRQFQVNSTLTGYLDRSVLVETVERHRCQPKRQRDGHQYGIGSGHSWHPPEQVERHSTISSKGAGYWSLNDRVIAKGRSSS
jgi:hypothetical protein